MDNYIGRKFDLCFDDLVIATNIAILQIARKIHFDRSNGARGPSDRALPRRIVDGLNGVLGEIGLSRLLNLPWTPGGCDISYGEIGGKLESRATEHAGGRLLLYESDKPLSVFGLMIGNYPQMKIAGFALAKNVMRKEFWRVSDPDGFWVPQSELVEYSVAMDQQRMALAQ